MRIVHVTRQFYPALGGLETVVQTLARRQAANGDKVLVITLDKIFGSSERLPKVDMLGGVEIIRLPFLGSRRYPIAPAILKHINDADIVHVHAIDFFVDYLAVTSFIHRKKLIISTHGGFFHTSFASSFKRLYFAFVTRLSITRYAFVAASSTHDLEIFSRIRRRGIEAVVNGVDCNKFAGFRHGQHPKQLIYFGRFATNKNLEALFPFLKAFRRLDTGWRLAIAGRPMEVTAFQLREFAKAAGLETEVSVIEAPSDDELRELICRSSIFVSPSRYEGFGIAAIEALSAGLLPVLSNISAHRDTVETTGMGILTDFSQPADAARETLDAWHNWRSKLPDEAQIRDRLKVYSWESVADKFERIYARAVGSTERLILATRIQVTSRDRVIGLIDAAVADRRPLRLAFVNANLANKASANPQLAAGLEDFYLLNDGIGLDLASLILYGRSFPENLNGTDFTPAYLDQSKHRLRLFLLGSRPHVVSQVAEIYCKRWPQHEVVGFHHGFFSPEEEAMVAEKVRVTRPDVVLVAMGNPRQEFWLSTYVPKLCSVGIGVGALFDFQTGQIPRAPTFLRRARLEWVHRLSLEPRRLWKRYMFGNGLFLARVIGQYARGERA